MQIDSSTGDAGSVETRSSSRVRPFLSVAICTHDRIDDVRRCLDGLVPQTRVREIPVHVVDSGSPPEAAASLVALCATHGVSYHRVDAPGVSLARNAALQVGASEWVAFLDDDAVPLEGWAVDLEASLRAAPSDVAIVGGRILPAYPVGAASDHIDAGWLKLLSCVDDPISGDISDGRGVCGANLAMRSDAIARIGGFPVNLGRVGASLLSCEESYVIERVQMEGMRVVYDTSFAVDHHIPAKRMRFEWAVERTFWESASWVRMAKVLNRPLPRTLNPLKLAVSIPVLWVMGLVRGRPRSIALRMAGAKGALYEQLGWNG